MRTDQTTVVRPESFNFEAKLPSSDGYSLYLRADDHRHIEIDLGSENNEEAPYITGDYETTGRVDRHGIDVDFGQFGHIDLHFAGSPKRQLFHSPNCKGVKPEVFQYGEMEGTVEFESLGGTVKLHTDRVAEGQTSHAPKRTCTPKPSGIVYGGTAMKARRAHRVEKGEGAVTTVMARAHTMGRTIDIYAFKLNHEFVPDMAATSTRRFGNVLTSTSVHAPDGEEGPGEAVKLSINGGGTRPRGAAMSAAAPFSGSATYRKRPGVAPSWLGSLAVEIPGEGTLSLAGPDFHAIACAYASNKLQRACERTVAPPHTAG